MSDLEITKVGDKVRIDYMGQTYLPWQDSLRAQSLAIDEAVARERESLRDQAATVTVRTNPDGMATLEVRDDHNMGWVAVSTDLITHFIEQRNADVARIQAEERARLRRLVETLGGYIREQDEKEYVPLSVVLMLFDGKATS